MAQKGVYTNTTFVTKNPSLGTQTTYSGVQKGTEGYKPTSSGGGSPITVEALPTPAATTAPTPTPTQEKKIGVVEFSPKAYARYEQVKPQIEAYYNPPQPAYKSYYKQVTGQELGPASAIKSVDFRPEYKQYYEQTTGNQLSGAMVIKQSPTPNKDVYFLQSKLGGSLPAKLTIAGYELIKDTGTSVVRTTLYASPFKSYVKKPSAQDYITTTTTVGFIGGGAILGSIAKGTGLAAASARGVLGGAKLVGGAYAGWNIPAGIIKKDYKQAASGIIVLGGLILSTPNPLKKSTAIITKPETLPKGKWATKLEQSTANPKLFQETQIKQIPVIKSEYSIFGKTFLTTTKLGKPVPTSTFVTGEKLSVVSDYGKTTYLNKLRGFTVAEGKVIRFTGAQRLTINGNKILVYGATKSGNYLTATKTELLPFKGDPLKGFVGKEKTLSAIINKRGINFLTPKPVKSYVKIQPYSYQQEVFSLPKSVGVIKLDLTSEAAQTTQLFTARPISKSYYYSSVKAPEITTGTTNLGGGYSKLFTEKVGTGIVKVYATKPLVSFQQAPQTTKLFGATRQTTTTRFAPQRSFSLPQQTATLSFGVTASKVVPVQQQRIKQTSIFRQNTEQIALTIQKQSPIQSVRLQTIAQQYPIQITQQAPIQRQTVIQGIQQTPITTTQTILGTTTIAPQKINIIPTPPQQFTGYPLIPVPPFLQGEGKKKTKKVTFKDIYQPSVEALVFNIKGKKPKTKGLFNVYKTGLTLRPIAR